MTAGRPISLKCFFTAWIFGWVVAIYVPSALIALSGISPLSAGKSFFGALLAVADEVAAAAKIGFAALLALMLFGARKAAPPRRRVAVAADMVLACLAMLATLLLLPAEWSRGFGIGITGARFDRDATLIYLAGAALAGLSFSLAEARCLAAVGTREPRA